MLNASATNVMAVLAEAGVLQSTARSRLGSRRLLSARVKFLCEEKAVNLKIACCLVLPVDDSNCFLCFSDTHCTLRTFSKAQAGVTR